MSKDKQIIRLKTLLIELIHQKYMLKERELYHRRIDYAQGLKSVLNKKNLFVNYLYAFNYVKKPLALHCLLLRTFLRSNNTSFFHPTISTPIIHLFINRHPSHTFLDHIHYTLYTITFSPTHYTQHTFFLYILLLCILYMAYLFLFPY
jgi:hypothetical protein